MAAWIRQRRLERCRRDLLDPALADLPVSAVAARWGLMNAAHFSRAFRAAYGLPPTEYRRAVSVPARPFAPSRAMCAVTSSPSTAARSSIFSSVPALDYGHNDRGYTGA